MSPVDLIGRMPRDTRKRRIRAGEHKIRRMDLKGFERIVAYEPPPLPLSAKVSFSCPPPHLPIFVPLAESVDIVRVPSGLGVLLEQRRRKMICAVRGESSTLAFSQELSGCARHGNGKTVFLAGMKPEARKNLLPENIYYRFEKWHARITRCHVSQKA